MDAEPKKAPERQPAEGSINLEKLLEERERLEALIKKKYTRIVTVMFTDIKGSTAMAENEGDVATRYIIKKHNDILIPLISENNGVLVKTMGDGTLSYFTQAQDAVRAAVRIQRNIDLFNQRGESRIAIKVRVGLNTGTGIVEQNDIYGDAVNVASRFETLANPGEIYLSESTYNALENRDEFYCRYIKTSPLKEKKGLHKVFKAFWDEEEIVRDRAALAIGGSLEAGGAEAAGASEQLRARQSPLEPEETDLAQEILRRVAQLEQEREFLELHLLFAEHCYRSTQELSMRLQEELHATERMELNFGGKPALWFYRNAISIGRFPEADFPLTNKAMSRVPIRIGIRHGEGWLKIEGRGIKDIKPDVPSSNSEARPRRRAAVNCPPSGFGVGRTIPLVYSKRAADRLLRRPPEPPLPDGRGTGPISSLRIQKNGCCCYSNSWTFMQWFRGSLLTDLP